MQSKRDSNLKVGILEGIENIFLSSNFDASR